MLKIFTTQLTGHFNRIADQEEYQTEDAARLLAQAAVGAGSIYLHGFDELSAILAEALSSSEPFPFAKPLFKEDGSMAEVTEADRVLIFSRFSNDEAALTLAKDLAEKEILFAAVSALVKDSAESLEQFADVHIDSKLKKPLIPAEDGSRYGFPAIMTSLYVYYALRFVLVEILQEYEEDGV
ncbi:DUF2529 domain-containing protein [Metabacillus sp. GX 13764]|uniref:DUF2529 domain-containing protein n=1 Tax=Metabacillus kandeliae TaxID=2900151 RepID=UPI001E368DB8|nr:DUF2529 domain-containing protein [Metabacillus kandeliae]